VLPAVDRSPPPARRAVLPAEGPRPGIPAHRPPRCPACRSWGHHRDPPIRSRHARTTGAPWRATAGV